jgi:magnesium transporter
LKENNCCFIGIFVKISGDIQVYIQIVLVREVVVEEEREEDFIVEESHSAPGNLMDSKASHLDDLLNEKLEGAFHKPTATMQLHDVAKIACEHSSIDLAYAANRLPHNTRFALYDNLPGLKEKIEFMVNGNRTTRIAVLRRLENEEIARLLETMPTDEGVWVHEDMSERRFFRILDLMEKEKAEQIRDLQKHSRNSAGRLMSNEYFAFNMEVTIGDVAEHIRDNPGVDLTRRIFIINNEEELQGYVPARNLIINPSHIPLRQIMRPVMHKVSPDASRDEVVDIVERYKIPALPVVDANDEILGVITYEDVLEIMEDIADDAFARMAGTIENPEENEPVYKRFLSRMPWLLVTFCAGIVSLNVLSYAEETHEAWFTALLFVIPLVTGMSGNVGLQSSTILVRSIATGILTSGARGEAVRKEMSSGALTGLAFGLLAGVVVYTFNMLGTDAAGPSPIVVSGIVSTGIFGACMTATGLGVFSPFFFARIGVDPAVAAGPIVTAFNDALSTAMFILIATWITSIFL